MALTNPTLVTRSYASTTGTFTSADQIATDGGSDVQTRLNESGLRALVGFMWEYDTGITSDPPPNGFRFNNADPELATTIYLDKFSVNNARYDEFLRQFTQGSFIYIQDQTEPTDNYLFQTSGLVLDEGGNNGWWTVPVTLLRSQGTPSATAGDRFVFHFLPAATIGSGTRTSGAWVFNSRAVNATNATTFAQSLTGYTPVQGDVFRISTGGEPFTGETIGAQAGDVLLAVTASPSITNVDHWLLIDNETALHLTMTEAHFLEQISESDVPADDEDVSAVGEATFVRFWLREDPVIQANVDNPGTGLRIDEAQEGSFEQNTNSRDTILYVGLPNTYVTSTGVANLRVRVLSPGGATVQLLPLATDFAEATEITVAGTTYYRTTGALGGAFLRYDADQVIRVFRTRVDRHFTATDAPVVDFTNNINDVPETRLDDEVQAKLNSNRFTHEDQQILNLFNRVSTPSADEGLPSGITLLHKFGGASSDLGEYRTTDSGTGIFGSFDGASTQIVAVPDNIELTSFTGIEAGSSTSVTEITPSLLADMRMFRVVLPQESSGTNFYLPNGIITTVTEYDINPEFKIGVNNLDAELAADIARAHDDERSKAARDFDDHLTVAYTAGSWGVPPNPPSLDATLTRRWAFGFDENRQGASPFTGNRFDDLPDPTLSATPVYSGDGSDIRYPGAVSFGLGRIDAAGAPTFGTSHNKLGSFAFFINDASFTGDIPILKSGSRSLLRLKVGQAGFADGIYVRVGNSDGAPATATFSERLQAAGSSSTIQYLGGVGASSVVWDVPDTLTFPLSLTARFKGVNIDTSVTSAEQTVAYIITDRDVDQALSTETVNVVYDTIGATDETIRFQYDGTTHQLTISTPQLANNGPNEVTRIGMEVTHDDSRDIETSTTTSDVALFTQPSSVLNTEVRIVWMLEAENPNETSADKRLSLKLIVQGAQENNVNLNLRESAYPADDWQIGPNSGTAIASRYVQIWDWDDGGVPFNAPTHAELYRIYLRMADYFGLATPPEEDYRTYTSAGNLVLTNQAGETKDIVALLDTIPPNRIWRDSAGFTSGDDVLVSLPLGSTVSDFIFVSVEWHTGTTDGSASDNANRRFAQIGAMIDIYDATGPNVILGAGGRGAESYGILATGTTDTATQITFEIINLNTTGGATLPTGSAITKVRFY